MKYSSWEDCVVKRKGLFSDLFTPYSMIQDKLAAHEKAYFQKILFQTASPVELSNALLFLAKHLSLYYQEKVVIVIDE